LSGNNVTREKREGFSTCPVRGKGRSRERIDSLLSEKTLDEVDKAERGGPRGKHRRWREVPGKEIVVLSAVLREKTK